MIGLAALPAAAARGPFCFNHSHCGGDCNVSLQSIERTAVADGEPNILAQALAPVSALLLSVSIC